MQKKQNLATLSLDGLRQRADVLKQLCLDLDPYAPLKDDQLDVLENLGLLGLGDYKENVDPFRLTNQLILSMEDTLEEIIQREKGDSKETPNSPQIH
jgi:hypothetical protein